MGHNGKRNKAERSIERGKGRNGGSEDEEIECRVGISYERGKGMNM